MDKLELKGAPEIQTLARWMVTLFLQSGFSFGLDADITLGQADLADYLATQGLCRDRETLILELDQAAAENGHIFRRREAADGVEYVARKRRLIEPAKPIASAPKPAAPSRPTAAPAAVAPPTPAGDVPITQQYQLAVLMALHRLGGSGKAADVIEMAPDLMALPEEHRATYARGTEGKSEQPKYVKFVQSARGFLIQSGELESPSRGLWAITPAGEARLRAAGLIK
jgi:hypothetical protein